MSFPYKYLKIGNLGKLRKITISNPQRKNALSMQAYQELTGTVENISCYWTLNWIKLLYFADGLKKAATDDTVAMVALTGDGDYYSSGNDIKEFLTVSDPEKELIRATNILKSMITTFYTFPKLLVCVVNGPCIGIACSTAALCDVIYATNTVRTNPAKFWSKNLKKKNNFCRFQAYFYTPFSQLGLCAEGGASYTFPRILGKSKANEMLLLNHKLSANEALQFNFVSQVYTKSELDSMLWPKLQEQSELSRESIGVTKKLITKFNQNDLDKACDTELEELSKRFLSEDFAQAVANFLQRKAKL